MRAVLKQGESGIYRVERHYYEIVNLSLCPVIENFLANFPHTSNTVNYLIKFTLCSWGDICAEKICPLLESTLPQCPCLEVSVLSPLP